MIRPWVREDDARCDAYVASHPGGRYCHWSWWRGVVERTFDHPSFYFLSEEAGRVNGVLPVTRLKSWLFGDFLVSVPYLNYGGPCADTEEVARALVSRASELARSLRVGHLEVRTEAPSDYGLQVKSAKVSMRLEMSTTEALWSGFPAKLRSQVRRAEREAMIVKIGRQEELASFYRVFARNMRDLGTPVYPKRFFANILAQFSQSWLCCVYLRGQPVAVGFLIGWGTTLEIPWASSLRQYNRLSPNMLLYWSVLQFACERGFEVFDFGRSSPDSGPFRFKQQWGARPVPLYWHYWLRRGKEVPELSPRNPRLQLAIRAWKRLPVSVTTIVGPVIVKSLP